MAKPPKLRVKPILKRENETTTVVCYSVVSGRGKELVQHLRDADETFARRVVASITAIDRIAALMSERGSAGHDGIKADAAANAKLLRDIQRIVDRAKL